MKADKLTIKDFAAAVGKSSQSIYKRLNRENDELKPFLIVEDNIKYISTTALKVVYNIDTEPQQEQPQQKEKEAAEGSNSIVIELLKAQIEAQQKELDEKNKQIQELMQQVSAAQQLVNQEQRLHLVDKQKIAELEEIIPINREQPQEQEQPKEKKKKGILSIFRRNKTE